MLLGSRARTRAPSLSLVAPFALCIGSFAAPALAQPAPTPAQATGQDEIVVTASPIAGNPDRFATIVSRIGRDDIVDSGGANLADALKEVPGVANTGFAAGASRPVIRGMDSNRVEILEDGVKSGDVSEVGPDHGVPIDPLSAQSIEVVRGAATLRYGSQAIGGVVNAINNRVPLTLPDAPFHGELTAAGSSNAGVGEGSALFDARAGQFAFHADGFARRASDYDTPDGTQTNSFFRGDGYSAGGSYFFGADNASRVGLAATHYDARYGIPSDETFIDMQQTKWLTNNSFALGAGPLQTLNVTGGYADYSHDEKDPDGTVEATFKNTEWDARAEALLGALGPLSSSAIGVQWGDRDYSALGEAGDFIFPSNTRTAALFAFTEIPIGRLHLQGATRAERVRVTGTPASDVFTRVDFTPVSGSLGALYELTETLKLGVTFTSAARAPNLVELFARGPHDGPGTFETGDPALRIERANSLELSLRYKRDGLRFEGSLWDARFDNFIYGQLTGNLCDDDGDCSNGPDAELRQLFYAQRDANFWGGEAKASVALVQTESGSLEAVGLADFVRADFASSGGPVPRIQPYRVGGGLDWDSGPFSAGFLALYVGKQDRVPAGDTPTDSYWNLDANVSWRPFGQNDMEVSLIGHNLTDDVQRDAVALNRDVIEQPGRDVRVVVRKAF
ncbi:MAG TPA: TonB-dependent receptor [Caulobacterales bacterium]|nr:TonB-dependent receptor [Caulobacterales bacterium]